MSNIVVPDLLATIGASTPLQEVEKVGDQMQLLADVYVFLIDEAP